MPELQNVKLALVTGIGKATVKNVKALCGTDAEGLARDVDRKKTAAELAQVTAEMQAADVKASESLKSLKKLNGGDLKPMLLEMLEREAMRAEKERLERRHRALLMDIDPDQP